jgi:membrane dipeptidase
MIGRRAVLKLSLAALATLQRPMRSAASPGGAMFERWTVINSCGGLDPEADVHGEKIDPKILQDALQSGMTAANQTIGYVYGDQPPFDVTVRDIALWQELIRTTPALIPVYRAADIELAKRTRRLGIILGFQSGGAIENRVERVDTFAQLGIRILQLTYNNQNLLGGGCLAPGNPGLTELGREVVARLNTRKVIVDVSHGGDRLALDAASASRGPIAVTHTGCRALFNHPRNVTDDVLRAVASKGGYVGIYFMHFLAQGRPATAEDLLAHLEHAIKLCGPDHVGVGTDGGTSLIDAAKDLSERKALFAKRSAAGIAAPGESLTSLSYIPELTGPGQFRKLAELLDKRGYSTDAIEKVLGQNFLRFAREVWGA